MERNDLIEKVAQELANNKQQTIAESDNVSSLLVKQASKFSDLAGKASEIIKQANEEITLYKQEIIKLAAEKKEAELALMENVKKEKATKLANEMCEKGIISTFDIEKKAGEITCMSSEAYEMLKDTVDNLPLSRYVEKEAGENCLDSLTFVPGSGYNRDSGSKESMAEKISDMANNI
jgi:hypothetical protein